MLYLIENILEPSSLTEAVAKLVAIKLIGVFNTDAVAAKEALTAFKT